MKEYGWRVPEAQRANLIMVEENMTALENGVQVRSGGKWVGKRDMRPQNIDTDLKLSYRVFDYAMWM